MTQGNGKSRSIFQKGPFQSALTLLVVLLAANQALADHLEPVPLDQSHPDETSSTQHLNVDGTLNGKVEKDDVASLRLQCKTLGFAIAPDGTTALPAKITQVLPMSPIARRGIAAGDKLIAKSTANGALTLTVEHQGQGMRFTIGREELERFARTALPSQVAAMQPASQAAANSAATAVHPAALSGNATETASQNVGKKQFRTVREVFEDHDLVLIIDRSGSMQTPDCPGGLSRWDWVCRQASDVAAAAREASSNIGAVVFSHNHETFAHVNPAELRTIFENNRPHGGTELAAPLAEQFDRYFATRTRPLVVVVITDGMPDRPEVVAAVVRSASRKLRYAGEVTLTFLLIGNDAVDENSLLATLGEKPGGSVVNGGMVDVVPFSDTASKGVKQALFEELRKVRMATHRNKPSNAAGFASGDPGSQPLPSSDINAPPGGMTPSSNRASIENALLDKYR